ncbi:MAG: PLP-dependent aminotransferase family protein [Desulfobacteraceae bacterium]|jgi:DNA-binding transcriptional MocR family regulator
MEPLTGFRYTRLADKLESQILDGTYRAGDKLPSIRNLRTQTGLSISTIYQTYIELERRGRVEPREKSGYFVKPLLRDLLPVPRISAPHPAPQKININNLAFALIEAMGNPKVLQLGGALVSDEILPLKEIASIVKSAPINLLKENLALYEHYLGYGELRRQIARRMAPFGMEISSDAVVITNGCIEAVALSLQSVTGPGDTVLVESPTFPWFLQLMEDLELNALEIPAHPQFGVDIGTLERAVEKNRVKACIFIPNFNNPLGSLMPDDTKKALVELCTAREIPIIEDDIYGELYFTASRPAPLKAYDKKAMVLYCASFSKNLAPGLRIGWALPGRYLDRFKRRKLNSTISGPGVTQWSAAKFLKNGNYERHLRKLRTRLKNQVGNTALAVARYFPPGTKISAPQGGFTLWVQLDESMDSLQIFREAIAQNIAVLPGIMCASGDTFNNCIRISCGMPYSDSIDRGLQRLANIVNKMASEQ